MNNPKLVEYVRQQLEMGITPEHIRANIASGGWNPADLDDAFKTLGVMVPATAAAPQQVQSTAPASAPMPSKAAPMPAPPVAPTTNASAMPSPGGVKYAGFWIRWVAVMVDGLILVIPFIIIRVLTGSLGSILTLIAAWLYSIILVNAYGATLGKILVGITVKSDDLQKISIRRLALRETVGKLISGLILTIGYIMAAFTGKKQALHDYMAHSVVVYKDPSKKHTAGLIVGIIIACIIPVIAILGIFLAVVLSSLNSARTLGNDARTKSILTNIRANAELYASTNGLYGTASDCSSGMFADPNISTALGTITTEKTCYADGTTYAISAKLSTGDFCVDSSGVSTMGVAMNADGKDSCSQEKPASY